MRNFSDLNEQEVLSGEEAGHRHRLIDLYKQRYGEFIPMIRRNEVRGFMRRPSIWLSQPLGLENIRERVETMEMISRRKSVVTKPRLKR